MAIWGEVELLCDAILDQGHKKAQEILSQANTEAERIVAEARDSAESEIKSRTLAEKKAAFLEAQKLVDTAELDARKKIIAFRERTVSELFDILKSKLQDIRNLPSYADFLSGAIREGVSALPGNRLVVEVNKRDVEWAQKSVKELGPADTRDIDIQPSEQVESGARIYTADRRRLYDNTPLSRFSRIEEDLRKVIWRDLFGSE